LLCSESEEAVPGGISSKAAACVAFGLIKIAGAFCVTKEHGVQDKLRREIWVCKPSFKKGIFHLADSEVPAAL